MRIQNLNPEVLMMEPAEDWHRCDATELLRPPKIRKFVRIKFRRGTADTAAGFLDTLCARMPFAVHAIQMVVPSSAPRSRMRARPGGCACSCSRPAHPRSTAPWNAPIVPTPRSSMKSARLPIGRSLPSTARRGAESGSTTPFARIRCWPPKLRWNSAVSAARPAAKPRLRGLNYRSLAPGRDSRVAEATCTARLPLTRAPACDIGPQTKMCHLCTERVRALDALPFGAVSCAVPAAVHALTGGIGLRTEYSRLGKSRKSGIVNDGIELIWPPPAAVMRSSYRSKVFAKERQL